MSTIQTIGVDLAKNVSSIHGAEACGGAHYRARTLNKLGHDGR